MIWLYLFEKNRGKLLYSLKEVGDKKKNGGQGQNRTADTGIFSLSFKLPIYINQRLIVIISVSHFTFKNKGLAN